MLLLWQCQFEEEVNINTSDIESEEKAGIIIHDVESEEEAREWLKIIA